MRIKNSVVHDCHVTTMSYQHFVNFGITGFSLGFGHIVLSHMRVMSAGGNLYLMRRIILGGGGINIVNGLKLDLFAKVFYVVDKKLYLKTIICATVEKIYQ